MGTGPGTEGHRRNDGTELETSPNLSPGRETRLPLRVKGEGEGPRLHFSFDQLDIGKVFVGSAHSYEVRWRRLCWVSAQHFCGWGSNPGGQAESGCFWWGLEDECGVSNPTPALGNLWGQLGGFVHKLKT